MELKRKIGKKSCQLLESIRNETKNALKLTVRCNKMFLLV